MGNILLKTRSGSPNYDDIYFLGGLIIKDFEGNTLFINYKNNLFEKGGHLMYDECLTEISFDYHTEEVSLKKELRETKKSYNRNRYDNPFLCNRTDNYLFYNMNEKCFFDDEFNVKILNRGCICLEPSKYGERYYLEEDGTVHCYFEHFEYYYEYHYENLPPSIKIKNSNTKEIFSYYDYKKNATLFSEPIDSFYEFIKNNNSSLEFHEFKKIKEKLEKLQFELSVENFFSEEALCQIADVICKSIENCDYLTLKQNIDDEILCRSLKEYSDEQLKRVLIKRKEKIKK